jgi:hypothetical protein
MSADTQWNESNPILLNFQPDTFKQMKYNDEHIDRLIDALRRKEPILSDADKLTESILGQIENLRTKKIMHESQTKRISLRQTNPMLFWIRAVTSSAAILLLGLFFYQQDGSEEKTASIPRPAVVEKSEPEPSPCFQGYLVGQQTLRESIYCYLQQNALENERFRNLTQPSNP